MNYQIKFNAWDKFEKKMILWKDMIENESLIPEVLLNSVRYIPLLFTGEYTKDNEEIYLGDICKCRYYKHSESDLYLTQEVYFDKGTFALKTQDTKFTMDDCVYSNCPISWAGILIKKQGNIYEGLKIDL